MSDEATWWAHQYEQHASGAPVAPLAAGWIARWPTLVRCGTCDKQLGANGDARSRHRCLNGDIR
jgi:hypothetical protein